MSSSAPDARSSAAFSDALAACASSNGPMSPRSSVSSAQSVATHTPAHATRTSHAPRKGRNPRRATALTSLGAVPSGMLCCRAGDVIWLWAPTLFVGVAPRWNPSLVGSVDRGSNGSESAGEPSPRPSPARVLISLDPSAPSSTVRFVRANKLEGEK